MYCTTCGKEINSGKEICTGCGFQGDYGNKFCFNCGKEVLPGQALCLNCGFMLHAASAIEPAKEQETDHKPKEKAYKKYETNARRMNIFTLITQIATVCLVFCLIFVPIYRCTYEPSLEDIETPEQFAQALQDGYLEKNFSLFDDIKILVAQLTSDGNDEFAGADIMMDFLIGMFALFEVIYGVVILIMTVSAMTKTVSSLRNSENSLMLTYNAMLKSGNENKKENIFKKQTVIAVMLFAFFDILYAKLFGQMMEDLFKGAPVRNMVNLSGFSAAMSIVIVMAVCYIAANVLKKKESEKMLLDIAKTEYDK